MSQVNSVPRVRRVKAKHDYASLNKRGLQSVKAVRTKSKIKIPKVRSSVSKNICQMPGSGDWRVELLNKYDSQSMENAMTGKTIDVVESGNSETMNNSTVGRGVTHSSQDATPGSFEGKPREIDIPVHSLIVHNSSDIIHLVLQRNSMEEKKRVLRENIAWLKQELQQKEEDDKLHELMKEEQRLRQQLAGVPGGSAVTAVEARTSKGGSQSKTVRSCSQNKIRDSSRCK